MGVNVFGIINLEKPRKEKLEFREPFEVFKSIYSEYESSFLLESMESDTGLARYSFIGFEPEMIIRAREGVIEIDDGDSREEFDSKNPFEDLRGFLKMEKTPEDSAGVSWVTYPIRPQDSLTP